MYQTLLHVWSQSKKYKKLSLDFRLIIADLLHNIPSDEYEDSLPDSIFAVGQALDALGRFQESEAISLEVAQNYSLASLDEEARAYILAGISCLRDVRYDDSLKHLLKSLQILTTRVPNNFDWSKGVSNIAVSNLLVLHDEIFTEKQHESNDGSGKHKLGLDEKLFASFACLLVKARFVAEDSSLKDILALQKSLPFMQKLKTVYHKPTMAKQLLIRSFGSEGVEGYKESLLDAMQGGDWVINVQKMTGPTDEHTMRREARRCVHNQIKESYQTALRSCSNCSTLEPPNEAFKNCPCRVVCYCSKECQVENWKNHRKTCPWNLEQKQKPATYY